MLCDRGVLVILGICFLNLTAINGASVKKPEASSGISQIQLRTKYSGDSGSFDWLSSRDLDFPDEDYSSSDNAGQIGSDDSTYSDDYESKFGSGDSSDSDDTEVILQLTSGDSSDSDDNESQFESRARSDGDDNESQLDDGDGGEGDDNDIQFDNGDGGEGDYNESQFDNGDGGVGDDNDIQFDNGDGGEGDDNDIQFDNGDGGEGDDNDIQFDNGDGGKGDENDIQFDNGDGGEGDDNDIQFDNGDGGEGDDNESQFEIGVEIDGENEENPSGIGDMDAVQKLMLLKTDNSSKLFKAEEKLLGGEYNRDKFLKEYPFHKENPEQEISALFGNQHYTHPRIFHDLGRRGIMPRSHHQYNKDVEAELKLDKIMKDYLAKTEAAANEPQPLKAPPEIVLSIAKASALLDAFKPKKPSEDDIIKDITRTGNYWNDVWKEDVDESKMLRNNNRRDLQGTKVQIEPGSKLYTLLSALKKISPKLLYVINKDD